MVSIGQQELSLMLLDYFLYFLVHLLDGTGEVGMDDIDLVERAKLFVAANLFIQFHLLAY